MTIEKQRPSPAEFSRRSGQGDRSPDDDRVQDTPCPPSPDGDVAFLGLDGEMSALVCATDWSQTPLGPVEGWPQSLKTAVGMMLGARSPLAIYWGDDFTFLYNDAWRELLGDTHPDALGRPAREVFSDVWDSLASIFERVTAGRKGIRSRNQGLLLASRSGFETVWFNHSFSPIPCADGSVGGILDIATEAMEQVPAELALRKRYRELVRYAPAAIYEIDFRRRRFTSVNEAMCRMTGYSREELLAMDPFDLIDEAGRVLFQARMAQWLRGETPDDNAEYTVKTKDGRTREAVLRVTFTTDDSGRPLGATVVAHDITERVRAEEALRRSQMDLRRAQEVGGIGSWRLDVRADVLTWSDEAYRIFGIPRGSSLTYKTFLETVHPDDRAYVDAQWQAALDGAPYDIEHRIIKDGEVRWIREKAYLEYDDSGSLLGGFGITQDISERKEAEKALRHYAEELEELNEANRLLLREVNHRVKNNLASIMGLILTEQMRVGQELPDDAEGPESSSPPSGAECYEAALEDLIKRVHSLATVHDLLSAGDWRPLEATELVEKVIQGSLPATRVADEVTLKVRSGEEPVVVNSDQAHHVALVIGELTTNSLKYGATRGNLHIHVDIGSENGEVWMVYRDRGSGYPEPVLAGERRSVGLELIQMIVSHSLRGSWVIRNEDGAVTEIRFPRSGAV